MPRILIVDDSPADRRLVQNILEGEADFQLAFAVEGGSALKKIEEDQPDVIVTDLVMPGLDGLQLVNEVRARFPAIPVILMTSKENARFAADALAAGAASYVPKGRLNSDLVDTIRNVFSVSAHLHGDNRLMESLTRRRMIFELPNHSKLIASLVVFIQDQVDYIGVCDESDRIRFGVALEEALSNAMYHGNLEVDSCLKESDVSKFDDLVEQRRVLSPYCHRRIVVEADLSMSQAVIVIHDEGPGFDPNSLPDPTDPENLDRVCGRGVLLMRTFMDEVHFNSRGNEVTLIKRGKSVPAASPS